jgi:hypothetical protein
MQNGQLNVDFAKASFATSFDVTDQSMLYKMATFGSVTKDGQFTSVNQFNAQSNMLVYGVLGGDGGATYLFQGNLTPRRVISGVTVWTPNVAR